MRVVWNGRVGRERECIMQSKSAAGGCGSIKVVFSIH